MFVTASIQMTYKIQTNFSSKLRDMPFLFPVDELAVERDAKRGEKKSCVSV